MPSSSSEVNEHNDDLDDLIFTPKSGIASPLLSPMQPDRRPSANEKIMLTNERKPSLPDRPTPSSPPGDSAFSFDPLTTSLSTDPSEIHLLII